MHRFYIEENCITGESVIWGIKESRHISRVLRLSPGEAVTAFDGSGTEYEVILQEVAAEQVTGKILNRKAVNRELPIHLELIQGIAKADKMDWIVQKAAEVGVSSIWPVLTRYTVVKLEEKKKEAKRQRWESIVREACKQCRRNTVPVVREVTGWPEVLRQLDDNRRYLLFYEAAAGAQTLREFLQQEKETLPKSGISILIGPEGGWSEEEIAEAKAHGIQIVGLGPRILRTETAGLVAAAAILYEMGALE